jgi:glycosyltransferase involved in cell wall biosynthesis
MEQSTLESLTVLRQAGHTVQMLSLHPAGSLKALAESRGIPLVGSVAYRLSGLNLIPWLLREIKDFAPDRILLTGHNFASLFAAVLSRKKTYLSIHFHHGDRSLILWKIFYSMAKRGCSGIRFISRFIHEEVAQLFTHYPSVVCFPNIFRAPEHQVGKDEARAQLAIPADAFVIGNAGWLIHRKAFDVFLRVAALVKKKIPASLFIIAGDGEEREALERQAEQLGITESVRFLGWQKNLMPFYGALDVLLFNTRFDALGRTPVEALCHGIPVVASVEKGGLSEFIRQGQEGFLIDEHNEEALANEIVRLHGDAELRAKMAAVGKARVLELGSPEVHLKNLSTFLELK